MGLRSDYKVMSRKPWSCIWCSFRMTSGLSVSFCSNPCLSHSFNMFQLCYSILQLMSLEVVRSHFTSSVADSVHAVIRSPSSYDSYELWNTVDKLRRNQSWGMLMVFLTGHPAAGPPVSSPKHLGWPDGLPGNPQSEMVGMACIVMIGLAG